MSAPLDIQLGRLDLASIGANRRHCLRVLPSSKGKKHKVVTGGEDGVVQTIALKKGQTEVSSAGREHKLRRGRLELQARICNADAMQLQSAAAPGSGEMLKGACERLLALLLLSASLQIV